MGSVRIRIRDCSKTTALPWSSASWIASMFLRRRATWILGRLSVPLRNKITEGLLSCRRANNVPKSVSAEIITRFSTAARVKISSSVAACIPKSRTWTASYPDSRKASATAGERALSIKNLTRPAIVGVPVPGLLPPRIVKPPEYLLAPNQERPR